MSVSETCCSKPDNLWPCFERPWDASFRSLIWPSCGFDRVALMQAPVTSAKFSTFRIPAPDGVELFVYRWLPAGTPRAVVQIAHGLAEHAGRYSHLADSLTRAGYAVYANDHRGHGHTAQSVEELGSFGGSDGWNKCVDDLRLANRLIASEQPGTRIALLGHSMGSSLALSFLCKYSGAISGAVLSGASGQPTFPAHAGRLITRLEKLRLGRHGRSPLVHKLTFGEFNKRFAPERTGFDWLSRDPDEVDKYVADPLCGFHSSVQLWIDLLDGWVKAMSRGRTLIPKNLPILVISGRRDPVSAGCRQIQAMLKAWSDAGLNNVEHKFYPEARHELFNEINREEVTQDLLEWLGKVIV